MRKAIRTLLLIFLVITLTVVGGGALIINDITRGPLPLHNGELVVAGLQDRVEILRDTWGVPHIYAGNIHDLFFAQGYTQAQDRWWQMELLRRTGNGQLQQLMGENASLRGTDVFARTVGWRRAAERDLSQMNLETQAVLQAFADGVNAYILHREAGDLALEYSALSLRGIAIPIEPWTPADTLVWGKVMQWDLSGNWSLEQFRQQFLDALGQKMWDDWLPVFPYAEHPTVLTNNAPSATRIATSLFTSVPVDAARANPMNENVAGNIRPGDGFVLGKGTGIGSNSWVVSGSRTTTGRPLLASDLHLVVSMPSLWYEIGLHCLPVTDACPYDVAGFTFSPNPAVIIGHNARIAWGISNLAPDTQDLYRIQVNPDDELQYQWNGKWRDMVVREEIIRHGNNAKTTVIQVRETHVGSIINDNQIDKKTGSLLGFNRKDPLALHWTATAEIGTLFDSVLAINRASDWTDFRTALALWDAPSQNFVFADAAGNIGYQMPGRIPIRAEGEQGLTPTNCMNDSCAWQGYLPFEQLPYVLNPERGYIVTANQPVVSPEYYTKLAAVLGTGRNYDFGQSSDVGFRAQRISEMIASSHQHSVASMQAIQNDNKLIGAEKLAPTLAALTLDDPILAGQRDWLLQWDYQLNLDSPQAAFYMVFLRQLSNNVYNDQLKLADTGSNGSPTELFGLARLVNAPNNAWWDNVNTTSIVETRDDILLKSLREAQETLVRLQGADRLRWRWGALHTTTLVSTPLGISGIDLIENTVNRGPVETSGGSSAVNATSWSFSRSGFDVRVLPSMRMLLDVGALENSLTINSTGQSGHPFSEHYSDMIEAWRTGKYRPMLWTREQLNAAKGTKLVLLPR